MTRFQGIETYGFFFIFILLIQITEMTRFQGIETLLLSLQLLYFDYNYRNDPIPGDWNWLLEANRPFAITITEMTRFQGIETS